MIERRRAARVRLGRSECRPSPGTAPAWHAFHDPGEGAVPTVRGGISHDVNRSIGSNRQALRAAGDSMICRAIEPVAGRAAARLQVDLVNVAVHF